MKKSSIIIISLFLLAPISIQAFTFKSGEDIKIESEEIHEGTLFIAGTDITINKTINGDVICAGQNVVINSEINGDVICAVASINIFGKINGNVRLLGDSMNLNSEISRNATILGNLVSMGNENKINGDLFLAVTGADLRGVIEKQVYGLLSKISIDAIINNDLKVNLINNNDDALVISNTAEINGDLIYTSNKKFEINEEKISGEITHHEHTISKKDLNINKAWSGIISIFSSLVIGLVLISLWRKPIKDITDKMQNKIGLSMSWGGAVLILTPFIVLFLLLTIIGIPLAIILLILWLITIYISKTITAILIGKNIVEKLIPKKKDSIIWAMIIGVTASWILFNLPVVGGVFLIAALLWGLGGISLYLKNSK